MNLLIITLHADPSIHPGSGDGGGTQMYISELIDMLIHKDIKTLVITRKASPGNDIIQSGSVTIHRIHLGPEGHWDKNNLNDREEEIKLLIDNTLTEHKFNPTLIHSIYWHSGRAGLYFAGKMNIPLVHTVISNGKRKKLSGFTESNGQIETEQKIYTNANVIIVISEQEKKDIMDLYGINSEKIKVVGRGVDNLFLRDLFDKNGTLCAKGL